MFFKTKSLSFIFRPFSASDFNSSLTFDNSVLKFGSMGLLLNGLKLHLNLRL